MKIESAEENDFIKRIFLTGKVSYWIGLTDSAKEGNWKWTDGTGLTGYKNWGTNQPGGSIYGEDCGAILMQYDDAEWHDYGCSVKKGFICEM